MDGSMIPGSELGNLGAASSAQAQQFHDAAMRNGAEHLRVSYDAIPHPNHRRHLVALLAVLAGLAFLGVAAVALVGIG
ncbi:MAG: hypothetical protein Q8M22_13895 [Actinomycetota bacterium]|nr:hypothetical protein [Actinomycetota bacterium]